MPLLRLLRLCDSAVAAAAVVAASAASDVRAASGASVVSEVRVASEVLAASRGLAVLRKSVGDAPITEAVEEGARWLEEFHPRSVVELDYGGIVQLIADPILESDTTADEVHGILEALRSGDVEELAELFSDLRDYWGELAAREHSN